MRNDRTARRIGIAFGLLGLLLAPAFCRDTPPAARCAIIDLGTLPEPDIPDKPAKAGKPEIVAPQFRDRQTIACALNDQGQVVGQSQGQAFLWHKRQMTGLGALPASGWGDYNTSRANAINDNGWIVGGSGDFGPLVMSGLYDCDALLDTQGRMKPLASDQRSSSFEPFGINNRNEIVGLHAYRGFFWARGKLTLLGTLSTVPAGNRGRASAINHNGQIVGRSTINGKRSSDGALYWHAVLWQRRGKQWFMTDLGSLDGYSDSEASAVNDTCWIVGDAATSHPGYPHKVQTRAFLWCQGRMSALDVLPGGKNSAARDLNNAGQIVGESDRHACLWQNGALTDLNTLLPEHSGWVLEYATAINNRGQIIGNGLHNGAPRAFLLTLNHHSNT